MKGQLMVTIALAALSQLCSPDAYGYCGCRSCCSNNRLTAEQFRDRAYREAYGDDYAHPYDPRIRDLSIKQIVHPEVCESRIKDSKIVEYYVAHRWKDYMEYCEYVVSGIPIEGAPIHQMQLPPSTRKAEYRETGPANKDLLYQVRKRLYLDPELSSIVNEIEIQTEGNKVILNGQVADEASKKKIEDKVKTIRGVKTIENKMEVLQTLNSTTV